MIYKDLWIPIVLEQVLKVTQHINIAIFILNMLKFSLNSYQDQYFNYIMIYLFSKTISDGIYLVIYKSNKGFLSSPLDQHELVELLYQRKI